MLLNVLQFNIDASTILRRYDVPVQYNAAALIPRQNGRSLTTVDKLPLPRIILELTYKVFYQPGRLKT